MYMFPLSNAAEHSSSQTKEKEDNSQPLYNDDDDELKDWNNGEEESRDERSKENVASFDLTQPGSQQKGMREL